TAVVRVDEPYRQALTDLGRIVVKSDEDPPVLLSTVAEIKRSTGPVEIERKYQQRLLRIAANTIGRGLGSISAELEDRFSRLPLTPGFSVRLGGQSERQPQAVGSLYFTSVLAIILVYMVLASPFHS